LSKVQTNNSYLQAKVDLRIDRIPDKAEVLDCFRGESLIWGRIKHQTGKQINVLGIDKGNYRGTYLRGDNLKFLKAIDIHKFNVINLDAYGIPFKQLEILFERNYKGIVFITFIQSMFGQLPRKMLNLLGYTNEMINKIPSLFNHRGFEKFKQYLALRGIKKINYINIKNKYYVSLCL